MDFAIQCDCGRTMNVTASQAGSTVTCDCGKTARVPTLGALKKSAGIPATPQLDAPYDWAPAEFPFVCQACGVEAATRKVTLHCNIGALFIRFPSHIRGRLCKSCIRNYFWRYTGTTAVAGWWGVISFISTPIILVNNIVQYVGCIGMEPVAQGATPPRLTQDAVDRIRPHADRALERINSGYDVLAVIKSVAETAGVTPGQVLLFLRSSV